MDYTKAKEKELLRLMKEKQKKDKKLKKEMEKRANTKYTTKYLKEAKKDLLQNAMTIDSFEYQQIAEELKKRLNGE